MVGVARIHGNLVLLWRTCRGSFDHVAGRGDAVRPVNVEAGLAPPINVKAFSDPDISRRSFERFDPEASRLSIRWLASTAWSDRFHDATVKRNRRGKPAGGRPIRRVLTSAQIEPALSRSVLSL